ncbi:hypothetical protein [Parahaliea aestuarii]|uniref:Uncharacterized protein n=1 Tax=Parahaliea aestuarii TaxID=1852021 RepID=A0A5C8ZZW4_9GAMM|nr:hypothetical protein [Parahaliea aestuarii]TXS93274.1 hypothetical protein FVW59_05380 [Parahaliea aestuarii]
MHDLVLRISEPDKCYVFARNAERQGHPELARQAYRRAVDLRAEGHDTASDIEFAAVRAIYAYEEALSYSKGKRTRATGTWQMANRYGPVEAVQKRLGSRTSDDLQAVLQELGMEDYSFTAVRQAYPEVFEQAAA